ncbi:RNA pyrophosphohydrolase [Suttonella sp. R2A3]|uniref:RNA pyrophosphohydrolase n=1 Tax=Suttonella sp. R2A3 TaxID=2908648 RepID=UPI001F289FCA|nr:RNA pyrophosphohydrolase [Suttonella sp. R2A3]UJF25439.1 RNA pyrophosphohydrolase [Suttonella sp. R2A3]
MFDAFGYRFNVGIIIVNEHGQALWGKRRGQNAWQFPQGGVNAGESSEQAMLRELFEETGLSAEQVTLLASTKTWLKYRLPSRFRRRRRQGMVQCIGQKQKWYLLQLVCGEHDINLSACTTPEFDDWCWIDYWSSARQVVNFKRKVYQQALDELAEHVPNLAPRPAAEKSTHKRRKSHYLRKASHRNKHDN